MPVARGLTAMFVRVEERALERTFGEEYLTYVNKVRRSA